MVSKSWLLFPWFYTYVSFSDFSTPTLFHYLLFKNSSLIYLNLNLAKVQNETSLPFPLYLLPSASGLTAGSKSLKISFSILENLRYFIAKCEQPTSLAWHSVAAMMQSQLNLPDYLFVSLKLISTQTHLVSQKHRLLLMFHCSCFPLP